ncbi:MAG TPA: prolyl oligopeptidase family serine peptidase [Vicinamibacterales bacterium]|jgi:dipeptidyl aminopeptidase/acylaminoacyl peptidase|nr:prolyl oligopeptidase family serine peptidase [Vicinamibacterales bacterium]
MLQRPRRLLLGIVLTICAAAHPLAQQKRPLSYDVYDGWRSIQNTQLSRDGTWLVYALVPEEADGELVARNLKTGAEYRAPRGKSPVITADGRFVVFAVSPTRADLDKAKKEKKKPEDQPKSGMGVMSLANGQVFTADRVKSFKVAEDGSRSVAYLLEPAKATAKKDDDKEAEKKEPDATAPKKKEKKKDAGTELIVRDLQSGTSTTIPDVVEYTWSKDGSMLAYGTSSKSGDADGAFVRTAEGSTTPLARGIGHYKDFAFDDAGKQLAFVSDRDDYRNDPSPFKLYYWTRADSGAAALVTARTAGMPEGMSVSENGKVSFSKTGAHLFFGTAPVPAPQPEDAPDPVKVDIWNYKDPLLQPMQRVRADEEKKRSYQAVVRMKDRKFMQLASPEMPDLRVTDGAPVALGESDVPYQQLISWDGDYNDAYVVDLNTGAKTRVLSHQHFTPMLSPGGNYILWYSDESHAWFAQKVGTTTAVPLTRGLKVSFEDETWDTPGQPSPYGVAGWTAGDKSVLLYDRYDIWEVKPDGTGAYMVTQGFGRQQSLVFRYQRLDPDERSIPPDRPLLLDTTDDRTKATGFYRITLAQSAAPEKVVMLDKQFGRPTKAKNADVLVYSLSRFEEFPDLWVSDGSFANMKKVTDANPQQSQYAWGTAELVDYVNADGKPLRGLLFKPDGFDASKKYPLMVYIYEELTNGLHSYHAPSPGTSINITRYVSNGYVVLEPDIVYDIGYPGESAFKCVIPAVQSVVAKGFVDPKRIGIQGHSWGGYEITYLITRTDLFRAVEAGASVANMISAYGGIRWGTGMSRAFQYEKTQSRIGGPPWVDPLQYIENSPIFWVEKIHTPYLTIHNDEDDAVPWYQGIEFFSAMRRLGKEAYMFSFNGEKHGLRDRDNQKYWTVHLDEFFDYYLLGKSKPEWMEKGVPYLERGRRDVTPLYEPAKSKTTSQQKGGAR